MIEILFCTFMQKSCTDLTICHKLKVQQENPGSIFPRVCSRRQNRHNSLLPVRSKTRGHPGLYFDSNEAEVFLDWIFDGFC